MREDARDAGGAGGAGGAVLREPFWKKVLALSKNFMRDSWKRTHFKLGDGFEFSNFTFGLSCCETDINCNLSGRRGKRSTFFEKTYADCLQSAQSVEKVTLRSGFFALNVV